MSPIISEEDVLAALVLLSARPIRTNVDATAQTLEAIAWNQAVGMPPDPPDPVLVVARARLRAHESIEAAIADSERRLEVELAHEAALAEVRRLRSDTFGPLGDAARRLLAVEREVVRHAR